ncbi:MAG: hypothetical protein FWD23_18850, partial [Oscillospiraceae bacterium]|nr:hypothetical protein [Oscillospiraceae bacterium]
MQASKLFTPVKLTGYNARSEEFENFLAGGKVLWGIPFDLGADDGNNLVCLNEGNREAEVSFADIQTSARYLIFVHASEIPHPEAGSDGIYKNFRGVPPISQTVCEYIINYADGNKISVPIRSRMEINDTKISWGQGAFLAEPHIRGTAFNTVTDDIYAGRKPNMPWGPSQYRADSSSSDWDIMKWLYAWENPHPDVAITGITVKHHSGKLFLMGVTAGNVSEHPLRYGRRRKFAFSIAPES